MSEPETVEARRELDIEVPEGRRLRLGRAFPRNEAIRSLRARAEFRTLSRKMNEETLGMNPLANVGAMNAASTTRGVAENRGHWMCVGDDVKQLFQDIVRMYDEGVMLSVSAGLQPLDLPPPGAIPATILPEDFLTTPPSPTRPGVLGEVSQPSPGFGVPEEWLEAFLRFSAFVLQLPGIIRRHVVEDVVTREPRIVSSWIEITLAHPRVWRRMFPRAPVEAERISQSVNEASLLFVATAKWSAKNLDRFATGVASTDDKEWKYLREMAEHPQNPYGFVLALLFSDWYCATRVQTYLPYKDRMDIVDKSGILQPTGRRTASDPPFAELVKKAADLKGRMMKIMRVPGILAPAVPPLARGQEPPSFEENVEKILDWKESVEVLEKYGILRLRQPPAETPTGGRPSTFQFELSVRGVRTFLDDMKAKTLDDLVDARRALRDKLTAEKEKSAELVASNRVLKIEVESSNAQQQILSNQYWALQGKAEALQGEVDKQKEKMGRCKTEIRRLKKRLKRAGQDLNSAIEEGEKPDDIEDFDDAHGNADDLGAFIAQFTPTEEQPGFPPSPTGMP